MVGLVVVVNTYTYFVHASDCVAQRALRAQQQNAGEQNTDLFRKLFGHSVSGLTLGARAKQQLKYDKSHALAH